MHSQGEEKKQTKVALEKINDRTVASRRDWLRSLRGWHETAAQEIVHEWLGGKTLDDRLWIESLQIIVPPLGGCFRAIKGLLTGKVPAASQVLAKAEEVRSVLRKYYQRPDFVQILLLFEGGEPKHVNSIQ